MLNQKLKVDVYGLSLAEIEGRRFAAVYIGQPAVGDDAKNNKGIVIMKMPAEPKVFAVIVVTYSSKTANRYF